MTRWEWLDALIIAVAVLALGSVGFVIGWHARGYGEQVASDD